MKKTLILLLFPLFMFAQDSTLVGDVDCSGEVNSQDASLILQFVTNVIDSLPCEANMTGLTPDQLQEMIDMMEDQLSINYTAGSGGGCNYKLPDGLNGERIIFDIFDNTYTVPSGKNLYIHMAYTDPTGGTGQPVLTVNGNKAFNFYDGYIEKSGFGSPIIAKSGDIISAENIFQSATIYGLLIDAVVDPVIFDVSSSSYTVPTGKNLYIYNAFTNPTDGIGAAILTINDYKIAKFQTTQFDYTVRGIPFVASSGDIISANNVSTTANIFGYLVDEDYFADCSGGGGSTTNSVAGTGSGGFSGPSDFSIEVDKAISIDFPASQYNDEHISCVVIDSMSNIFVSLVYGYNSSNSTIQKYDVDLNLIWSMDLDGCTSMLKINNNQLYVSGKEQYSGNWLNDFVAKIDTENGSLIWYKDVGNGNSSQGELLEVNDQHVVYVRPDFISNGNNGSYVHIFDNDSGDYDTYNIYTVIPECIAIDGDVLYIGTSYNGNNFSYSFDLTQPSNSTSNSFFGFNNNEKFIVSNSQVFSYYLNYQSDNFTISNESTGNSFGIQHGDSHSVEFSSSGFDNIKPSDNGVSFLFNFTNPIVNFQSQAIFENISNGFGYFLLDFDMNLNLVGVKPFPMICESFDSFKYGVSNNKHAVGVTLNDDCNQIYINNEPFSGHILMIY